jgi:hypothetical protein
MAKGADHPGPVPNVPTSAAPVIRATVTRRWAAEVDTRNLRPTKRMVAGGWDRCAGPEPPTVAGASGSDFVAGSGTSSPFRRKVGL